jgi:uncharacterized membrane protein YqjE
MAILDSVVRLGATLIDIIHTRLELISLELEEELVRFSSYLLLSLIALFAAGIAVLLAIFLLIVVFWDTHRIAVVGSLFAVFSSVAVGIAFWLRHAFRNKPRLLASSLAELRKDSAGLRGSDADE